MVISKRIALITVFLAGAVVQAGENPEKSDSWSLGSLLNNLNSFTKKHLTRREEFADRILRKYSCNGLASYTDATCSTVIPSVRLSEPRFFNDQRFYDKRAGRPENANKLYRFEGADTKGGMRLKDYLEKAVYEVPQEMMTRTPDAVEEAALQEALNKVNSERDKILQSRKSYNNAYADALEGVARCIRSNSGQTIYGGNCNMDAGYADIVSQHRNKIYEETEPVKKKLDTMWMNIYNKKEAVEDARKQREAERAMDAWILKQEIGE